MMSSRCSRRERRAGQPYVADRVHLLRLHDAVEKVNSEAIKARVPKAVASTAAITFLFC